MELTINPPDKREINYIDTIRSFHFSNKQGKLLSEDENLEQFDFKIPFNIDIFKDKNNKILDIEKSTDITSCENPYYDCKFYVKFTEKKKGCCCFKPVKTLISKEIFSVFSREINENYSTLDTDNRFILFFYYYYLILVFLLILFNCYFSMEPQFTCQVESCRLKSLKKEHSQ